MKLNQKVAIVTGAVSALGCEIARAFAGQGARVMLMDREVFVRRVMPPTAPEG